MNNRLSNTLQKNPTFLAPMAGYTDLPTRIIASRYGVGATVSELVSVKGFIHSFDKCVEFTKRSPEEKCFGIQLMGSIPEEMAYVAGKISEEFDCDFIDINMGCPAKKVLKSNSGVALMKEPELAEKIIGSVVESSKLPVTVKMRTGISETSDECYTIGKIAQECGSAAIFIHGRSKTQMFNGEISYEKIKKMKSLLSIPIIGNGGIRSVEDGRKLLEKTNCDGIMVGMGAMGKPWIFKNLYGEFYSDNKEFEFFSLEIREIIDIIVSHGELAYKFNKNKKLIPFRKQLLWYTKGWPSSSFLRRELVKITEIKDLKELMREYLEYHV